MELPARAGFGEGYRDSPRDPNGRQLVVRAVRGGRTFQLPDMGMIYGLQRDVIRLSLDKEKHARLATEMMAKGKQRVKCTSNLERTAKAELEGCQAIEKDRMKVCVDFLHMIDKAKANLAAKESPGVEGLPLGTHTAAFNVDNSVQRLQSLLAGVGPSPASTLGYVNNERAVLLKRREEVLNAKVVWLDHDLTRLKKQGIGVATSRESVLACFSADLLEMNADWLRQQMAKQCEVVWEILDIYDQGNTFITETINIVQGAIDAYQSRKTLLVDVSKALMEELRELLARMEDHATPAGREAAVHQPRPALGTAPGTATVAVTASPPSPPSTIRAYYQAWMAGDYYLDFVRRTRETVAKYSAQESKDRVMLATIVLNRDNQWCIREGNLGEGGFGTVYKMGVPTLGESFALKTMKEPGVGPYQEMLREGSREGLVTEMFVHRRVPEHPNIVRVVSVDDRNPEHMYIMYELAASDFEDDVWGRTSTRLSEKMRLLSEVAAGLEFLHEQGIVHNDIKPQNILVFPAESGKRSRTTAKIADMGLALLLGETRDGQGTNGCKPPETMLGQKVPCRADQDVFSIAHMLLLTITKPEWKGHNMFASKAVRTVNDVQKMGELEHAEAKAYRETLTHRNMVSNAAHETLLRPYGVLDELGSIKTTVLDLIRQGLSADPAVRPTMRHMRDMMAAMSDCLSHKESILAAAAARRPIAVPAEDRGRETVPANVPSGGGDGGMGSPLPALLPTPAGGEYLVPEPEAGAAGGVAVAALGTIGGAGRGPLAGSPREAGASPARECGVGGDSVPVTPTANICEWEREHAGNMLTAATSRGAGPSLHPPLWAIAGASRGPQGRTGGIARGPANPVPTLTAGLVDPPAAIGRTGRAFVAPPPGLSQQNGVRLPSRPIVYAAPSRAPPGLAVPATLEERGSVGPCPLHGHVATIATRGIARGPANPVPTLTAGLVDPPAAIGRTGRAFVAPPPGFSRRNGVRPPSRPAVNAAASRAPPGLAVPATLEERDSVGPCPFHGHVATVATRGIARGPANPVPTLTAGLVDSPAAIGRTGRAFVAAPPGFPQRNGVRPEFYPAPSRAPPGLAVRVTMWRPLLLPHATCGGRDGVEPRPLHGHVATATAASIRLRMTREAARWAYPRSRGCHGGPTPTMTPTGQVIGGGGGMGGAALAALAPAPVHRSLLPGPWYGGGGCDRAVAAVALQAAIRYAYRPVDCNAPPPGFA